MVNQGVSMKDRLKYFLNSLCRLFCLGPRFHRRRYSISKSSINHEVPSSNIMQNLFSANLPLSFVTGSGGVSLAEIFYLSVSD
jgi:hypothetical protein